MLMDILRGRATSADVFRARGRRHGRTRAGGNLASEKGTGLIEVLIAVVVLAIIVVPVFNAMVAGRVMTSHRGQKRMALRLVERKVEQLMRAGYGSIGSDADVSSVCMTSGAHPTDPTIIVSEGSPQDGTDDVLGSLSWTVTPVSHSSPGDSVRLKSVEVKLRWPDASPRDSVSMAVVVGS